MGTWRKHPDDGSGRGDGHQLGTSYAAPHVGGVAGLYLSINPAATPAVAESAVRTDAVLPGTVSRDGRPVRLVYAGKY